MNKRAGIYLIMAIFCCNCAFAGTFLGLEPGVSKKKKVNEVLGKPVREVVKNVRYDYPAEGHESKRISIVYDEEGTILSIDLYFTEPYPGEQVKKWFSLKEAENAGYDQNGNFVESYPDKGISLHHDGPEESSPVIFFSHYYDRPEAKKKENPRERTMNTAKDAEEYFNKGRRLIENGKNSEAIGPLKKAVLLDPGDGVYRLTLGTAYCELGQYDLAIPELKRSLEIGTDSKYPANYMLGIIYWMRKDFISTIDHLEKAIEAKPENVNPKLLIYLGASYYYQKNYPRAKTFFLQAYDMDSTDPLTVYYLGACNDALRQKKEAVFFYNKYLQMGHDDPNMKKMARQRMKALGGRR